MMQIRLISFQGVNKDGSYWGMVRVLGRIAKYINAPHKYLVRNCPQNCEGFVKSSNLSNLIIRLIDGFGRRLRLNIGLIRYLQEKIFDLFVSFKISYPIILISTAYVPLTAVKNKRAGGVNIFIVGNPYERKIQETLNKECVMHGVKIMDSYTYEKRLNSIDRYLGIQDYILFQTQVAFDSYLHVRGDFRKIHQYYEILPDGNNFMAKDRALVPNKTVFIYMANTVWLKGLTYLLEAWSGIDTTHLSLMIVGGIHREVQDVILLKNHINVEFISHVNHNEVANIYSKADVCIVPSLYDDHPATIAEALACGLPVITTNLCGSSVLIKDFENGFVIEPSNLDSLADKIRWFANNREQIPRMSKNSVETIDIIKSQNHDVEFAELINQIIESNQGLTK